MDSERTALSITDWIASKEEFLFIRNERGQYQSKQGYNHSTSSIKYRE